MDLYDAFECAFTYAWLHLSSLSLIYMLVWYMLVVGLNDEMKNQHAQDDSQMCLAFVFTSGTRTLLLLLTSQGIQCLCFAIDSKWYLTYHGAKNGIIGAL